MPPKDLYGLTISQNALLIMLTKGSHKTVVSLFQSQKVQNQANQASEKQQSRHKAGGARTAQGSLLRVSESRLRARIVAI